jgi:hypothetical protein
MTPALAALTVTVVDCVMESLVDTTAVAVYVLVEAGVTGAVPCGRVQGLHTVAPDPSVMLRELGLPFATRQESVEVCPGAIVFGLAVSARTIGTNTVTDCGPALPPGPVAVIAKSVVVLTGMTAEPEVGSVVESSGIGMLGVIVTEVAFCVAQVRVVVWPLLTVLGLTLNWVIVGVTGWTT